MESLLTLLALILTGLSGGGIVKLYDKIMSRRAEDKEYDRMAEREKAIDIRYNKIIDNQNRTIESLRKHTDQLIIEIDKLKDDNTGKVIKIIELTGEVNKLCDKIKSQQHLES